MISDKLITLLDFWLEPELTHPAGCHTHSRLFPSTDRNTFPFPVWQNFLVFFFFFFSLNECQDIIWIDNNMHRTESKNALRPIFKIIFSKLSHQLPVLGSDQLVGETILLP